MDFSRSFLTSLIVGLLLISCSKNEDPKTNLGSYSEGFFITNEGPFNNGSGTITHVSVEGVVSQNVFKTENNEDLGNIVQSMALANDKAYIVVNNSQKVVVADRNTMKKIGEIRGDGVGFPRYMLNDNDYGFMSNWGNPNVSSDDFITVIDLVTDQIVETIAVGEGPESMVISNNKLFVALEGGFGQNNKVVIIDTKSFEVIKEVQVGDVPNSIQRDRNGNVWVLCGGKPAWTGNETAGKMLVFDKDLNIEKEFEFELTEHPQNLVIGDGLVFYQIEDKVFRMQINDDGLPENPLSSVSGFFYSMTYFFGTLYLTDAKDYASEGILYVHDAVTGIRLETFETGIVPGGVYFQNK